MLLACIQSTKHFRQKGFAKPASAWLIGYAEKFMTCLLNAVIMRKALEVSDRVIDRLLGPAVNQIKAIPSNWAVCVCVCGGGCISAFFTG